MRVIYDLGANNGDDTEYYLLKADRVVAVEANPDLCNLMRKRFAAEITDGRLEVLNCVITAAHEGPVDFWLHETNHELSTAEKPGPDAIRDFTRRTLPGMPIARIVDDYGVPWYLKIDIQGSEKAILSAYLAHFQPKFVSVEFTDPQLPDMLVGYGYASFAIVDAGEIAGPVTIWNWQRRESSEHSFSARSTGPYGFDLRRKWMSVSDFLEYAKEVGTGWRDIHATTMWHGPGADVQRSQRR